MDNLAVFKQFLNENEILIVDKNPSSRNRLLKTISDLGAKRHMVHTCGNLIEAQDIINTKKIGFVLSDYAVGGGSGFDLFKLIREKSPGNKNICLILVTANISQTAVAKAAEEDVDSFIIKPYTVQSIQENLISTVVSKIKPSDYIIKIEESKLLISAGKFDEAVVLLKEAMKLHAKPALALFYLGQAEYLKKELNQASGSYNKGLAFNNIHYKCLIGLFDLLMKDNKFDQAYEVLKKIAKYFPANPERLVQVVRLAIQTENYEDMQMYYDIFTQLDERNSFIINHLGAGMYVAGKHCMLNDKYDAALKYFDNVAVSCSEFPKFIRAIIVLLFEHDKGLESVKYLSRFSPMDMETEDYLVSDFLVTAKTVRDNNQIVRIGLELYNKNIRDYHCMTTMIDAMEKLGYNSKKMQPFINDLGRLWPDKIAA